MNDKTSEESFQRLVLRNVRCFHDAEIELDPHVTVVIGENGSGKTTVVEALASLSYGEGEGLASFPVSRRAKSGEISLFEEGRKRPVAGWKSSGSPNRLPEQRYLFAYGRYRRVYFPEEGLPSSSPSPPSLLLDELAKRSNQRRTVTVFRPDNHLLRDLSRYLAALHFASQTDPRLESVWKRLNDSLRELGQGIEGIVMEPGRLGYIPRVVRNGLPLELRELSDGYQAILVIVFDLILRYIFLFPLLDDPLQGTAMVAIDEVDLHLHPRWQRTVVRQLVTLFPRTQFLLTTHSPAVVQGAIDSKRGVVTLREEDGAAVPYKLTPEEMNELEGAEIGSVLLEEKLFGVGSRYSPKYSRVEDRVEKVRERVERGKATEEERAQLFTDLDTLQSLVAADEERRADGSFMSQMTGLRKAFLEDLAAEIEKAKQS
jgi:energy-coupling factor transporter ATP-binding protein EcfA2